MDQEIVDELFSRIRTNPDGTTTINDFIDVWLQADLSVRRIMETHNREIEENQLKRDETAIQLKSVKDHETYNPNMVINESKFTVEVFEGQGFVKPDGSLFEPIVFIFCEKQKYRLQMRDKQGNVYSFSDRIAM